MYLPSNQANLPSIHHIFLYHSLPANLPPPSCISTFQPLHIATADSICLTPIALNLSDNIGSFFPAQKGLLPRPSLHSRPMLFLFRASPVTQSNRRRSLSPPLTLHQCPTAPSAWNILWNLRLSLSSGSLISSDVATKVHIGQLVSSYAASSVSEAAIISAAVATSSMNCGTCVPVTITRVQTVTVTVDSSKRCRRVIYNMRSDSRRRLLINRVTSCIRNTCDFGAI